MAKKSEFQVIINNIKNKLIFFILLNILVLISFFYFYENTKTIKSEFIPKLNNEHSGYAWCSFRNWPKPLHLGLRNTLQSKANLTKLETVFETIEIA